MKMIKKLLTILFVVVSLFAVASFAACGQSENPPVTPTPPDGGDDDSGNTNTYYPVLEVYSNTTQIAMGQSIQIEPVLSYGGNEIVGTFTYMSSDDTIISVDETGRATGLKVGTATVKVSCTYNGVSLEETVQIKVLSLYTFEFAEDNVSVGTAEGDNTVTVEYYLYKENTIVENSTIEWTIADESVATVNNGVVTGVAYGKTTLTATFNDISIEIPVNCYVSTIEGEINSFCHYSRQDSFKAAVITTGEEIPYAFVSTAVGGKKPMYNNFLKITVTKNNTYPGLYLSPMVTKQDLLDLQEKYNVSVVEFSMYLEKIDSNDSSRIPRRSWNGVDSNFGYSYNFDKWFTISIQLQDIINNYDRFASQEDALFYIPNKTDNKDGDPLTNPSAYNIYVDAVMAKTPTIYTISTVEDFLKINEDLSGYYELANDIDFSVQEFNNSSDTNVWYAIGMANGGISNYDKIEGFTGIIDGNGYTLKNVTVKGLNGSGISAALIAKSIGATIKNLGVEITLSANASNESAREVGLIGQARNTTIENCYIRLKTKQAGYGSNYIGVVASQNYSNTIKNCVSVLDVSEGFTSSNKTTLGSVVGLGNDTGTKISNTYSAMLRSSSDTQELKIAGSATNITIENSSVSASLAELYNAISADGVLASVNGWNMNIWSVANNTLKFGTTTIYSAE